MWRYDAPSDAIALYVRRGHGSTFCAPWPRIRTTSVVAPFRCYDLTAAAFVTFRQLSVILSV